MIVTLPFCLAFAYAVSHHHDMRKSAIPVPEYQIIEYARNQEAADYAMSLPKMWNRGKVEIWARDHCREAGPDNFTVK